VTLFVSVSGILTLKQ